jgi:hypothetical protein
MVRKFYERRKKNAESRRNSRKRFIFIFVCRRRALVIAFPIGFVQLIPIQDGIDAVM